MAAIVHKLQLFCLSNTQPILDELIKFYYNAVQWRYTNKQKKTFIIVGRYVAFILCWRMMWYNYLSKLVLTFFLVQRRLKIDRLKETLFQGLSTKLKPFLPNLFDHFHYQPSRVSKYLKNVRTRNCGKYGNSGISDNANEYSMRPCCSKFSTISRHLYHTVVKLIKCSLHYTMLLKNRFLVKWSVTMVIQWVILVICVADYYSVHTWSIRRKLMGHEIIGVVISYPTGGFLDT